MNSSKLLTIFLLLVSLSFVFYSYSSKPTVLINSLNYMDIFSGISYSYIQSLPFYFVPTSGSSPSIIAMKMGKNKSIYMIKSKDKAASALIDTFLRNNNDNVNIYYSTDPFKANLYLANKSGAVNFIILDPHYADSAVSVLYYAKHSKSFILYANAEHINDVVNFLKSKSNLGNITIYGYINDKVLNKLRSFNPKRIGNGESRYLDNIQIVKLAMDKYNANSVIITDGNSLEYTESGGNTPILFIGKNMIPDDTKSFIEQTVRSGQLISSVLIDQISIAAVHSFRDQLNKKLKSEGSNHTFNVWIKFGQVLPGESSVYPLDRFPIPIYHSHLIIRNVVYNNASKSLMVTVQDLGGGPAYYIIEADVLLNGKPYKVLSTDNTKFIDSNRTDGLSFNLDISNITEGSISVKTILRYGSRKKEFDTIDVKIFNLTTINYIDNSNISILDYGYNNGIIFLNIRNNGDKPVYVFTHLNLTINGKPAHMESDSERMIKPGVMITQQFPVKLSDSDLSKGITAIVKYGGKPGFLSKEKIVHIKNKQNNLCLFAIIIVALIVLIGAYLYTRRKKSKSYKR